MTKSHSISDAPFHIYEDYNTSAIPTTREPLEITRLRESLRWILLLYPPLLLSIGITGNLLTILILRSRSLRNNFVALFLTYLASFNLLNLFFGLTRLWIIGLVQTDIRHTSIDVCKYHLMMSIVLHVIANWTMTLVALCKLVYVVNPNKATVCCTNKLVHSVMFTLIIFFTCFEYFTSQTQYEYRFLGSSGRLTYCSINHKLHINILQAVMFYFIPGSLIIFINCGIIFKVRQYNKANIFKPSLVKKKERIVHLLAYILFACDIQILLNELPYTIFYTLGESLFEESEIGAYKAIFFYHISAILLYTNYSINFVIYCFFGDHFREELRRMLRPCLKYVCRKKSRWVESTVEDSTSQERNMQTGCAFSEVSEYENKMSLMNLFDVTYRDGKKLSTVCRQSNFPHALPERLFRESSHSSRLSPQAISSTEI